MLNYPFDLSIHIPILPSLDGLPLRHLPYTTYTTPLSISLFGMATVVFPLAVADNINNGDEPIAFALVESSDELSINTATNTSATTEDEVNDDGVMVN